MPRKPTRTGQMGKPDYRIAGIIRESSEGTGGRLKTTADRTGLVMQNSRKAFAILSMAAMPLLAHAENLNIEFDDSGFERFIANPGASTYCVSCEILGVSAMVGSLIRKETGEAQRNPPIGISVEGEIAVFNEYRGELVKISEIAYRDDTPLPPVSRLTKTPECREEVEVDVDQLNISTTDHIVTRIANGIGLSLSAAIGYGLTSGRSGATAGGIVGMVFGLATPLPSHTGGFKKNPASDPKPGQIWVRISAQLPNGKTPSMLVMAAAKHEPMDPKELMRATFERIGQRMAVVTDN